MPTNDTRDPNKLYTIDDLQDWPKGEGWLAVLGFPIEHSVSPPMHNAALAEMAQSNDRFANWRYFRFQVEPEHLPRALPALHKAGFRGVNLTIPHKVQAVDLVSAADEEAQAMGAVNTLVWQQEGYHGRNSDGYGLEKALGRDLNATLAGNQVVLLGAGGAARAAAVQCVLSGAEGLWIGNRNQERLEELLAVVRKVARGKVTEVHGFTITTPPEGLPKHPLVINATSLGLRPEDDSPLDLSRFLPGTRVYDMIYNPAETALLRQARQLGMPTANGLSMLVWQGVRSLEIWSGNEVPAQAMMRAACSALGVEPRDA